MKLKTHDMEAENDKVVGKDYLDLLDIIVELEVGVDVERVLSEEVHIDSFNQDTRESFLQGTSQLAITSRPSFDSTSVEHSSRPSTTGTFAFDYDGSRREETNDGSNLGNDGGNV
ncbi:hypothetical protein CK203_115728 [Vitis vinifera]|uniref:Uncharacterized protein n=1 Tax=Vitis vinifera TaxID=29760 RepID=A0A438C4Y3_VITVI|nr:hypothetical protein CK203_115728 [Vitis vinifera]